MDRDMLAQLIMAALQQQQQQPQPQQQQPGMPPGAPPPQPYANESIFPAWMDRFVPSVKGIALTGNPFATQQQMNQEINRRGLGY
jgi:hypothetical protein